MNDGIRIQWRRVDGTNAIPCFQEVGKPGWRPYTVSPHRQPDRPGTFSPGMATWRYWLRLGYEVVPGVGE